ncbi:hypothetical protein D9V32_12760 [Mycetocola tolaasinivorans]|uniref:Mannose-6-phosphate isomerase n=1 Tax=Mycetocola tolaasinivorans TaxID=76635 RepID=A0A3L7A378_9MICO|nr:hypothetical protein [Mycetocola tolaasinivorans]RLP74554.1 hypothetical protein D9V32_12760 [Mycetocola tolaasinivorans]
MHDRISAALAENGGILKLDAALVARDWLPPGRRLGLTEEQYNVGERGFICERWLGSTTHADNKKGPADEGVSYIRTEAGDRINLEEAIAAAPELIMGAEYASTHDGLGRLAKIYDFGARIPFHIHPPTAEAAKVGRNSKDEAYYFPPGVDMGAHPETFFGVHPYIVRDQDREILLPYLEEWKDDAILKHAFAYQQVAEEGFFIDSGILHAPGTALTIELQEDSDTLAMFQALNAGEIISKDLLYKDISDTDREELGERAALRWVDWEANGDPEFYSRRHIAPVPFKTEPGVDESWIFCGTQKFSGKRLRLAPGARVTDIEKGVFNILVWRGEGTVGGVPVRGEVLGEDELLVVHEAAVREHEIVNTGTEELFLIKFFGPDINDDAPDAGIRAA